jgi:hypothetical protein
MHKLYSAAAGVFVATAIASAAQADAPDISAQRLLSAWKGEDPNMRMVAEVIASAFASGLSWKGSLGGKEVYCPPPGFKGGQVMTTLDEFLASNPDLAEKSYGDAMAMSCVPVPEAIAPHSHSAYWSRRGKCCSCRLRVSLSTWKICGANGRRQVDAQRAQASQGVDIRKAPAPNHKRTGSGLNATVLDRTPAPSLRLTEKVHG